MSFRERVERVVLARGASGRSDPDRQQLAARLEHLEALVEGLQDAVHRDAVRSAERLAQLEHKTEPEVLAKALSDDARRRGL